MQNGFKEVYNLSGGYKTYEAVTESKTGMVTSQPLNRGTFSDSGDPSGTGTKRGVKAESMPVHTFKIDACGMQCPGPILKMKKSIDEKQLALIIEGSALQVVLYDYEDLAKREKFAEISNSDENI